MNVLVLGGTRFLGRAVVDACLARGDRVTIFHRGLSASSLPEGVESVLGDREVSLAAVARAWDLVVDTSGYEVPAVRRAARLAARRYVFVSSVSVYADPSDMREEGGALQTVEGADDATLTLANYGALEAACERALADALPDRSLAVRAGLILGPHDNDDRFAWWLRRVARGGEVLAPGDPDAPVQIIDARDLAQWIVGSRAVGVANALGDPTPMRELFEAMRVATGSDARFTWVPDEILVAEGVAPYSEMPFWLPASLGAKPAPNARAKADGLAFRPLLETARDTWAWLGADWACESAAREHKRFRVPAGISEEREQRLLRNHRARQGRWM